MGLKSANAKRWTRFGYPLVVFSFFACFGYVSPALPFFRPRAVPPLNQLAKANPPTTAMMDLRANQAAHARKRFHPRQEWVPLSRVSPTLINAAIAAEDSTFYSHRGVEWGLTRDVLLESLRTGRRDRGASTITQQVARNLYLSPQKTYLRKIREIVLAQRLEQNLPKKRILEIYLNIAEWGEGIFGVEAASRTFFGKSAADLTWDEATAMVAVLPSPRRHHPTDNSRWVAVRKEWVLRRLIATGRYTPPETVPDTIIDQNQSSPSHGGEPGELLPKAPISSL
jgi:monofunctional biosynthetic peptidoglycan transglycosylase